jgi:hypothetical protein
MKMEKSHFEFLKSNIREVANKETWVRYKNAGLSEMRYRWDMLRYAGVTSRWIVDNLYPYLNDDHIDTALRKICKEDYSNV